MPSNSNFNSDNSNNQFVLGVCLIAGFFIITAAWRTYLDNAPKTPQPVAQTPPRQNPSPNVSTPPNNAPAPTEDAVDSSPNAYDFYVLAADAFKMANSEVNPETKVRHILLDVDTELTGAALETWLAKHQKALRLLREGLKYSCRLPPPYIPGVSRPDSRRMMDSLSTRAFYSLAQTLVLESRARRERGDWNGAAQSLLDLQKFGHDLSQGGAVRGGTGNLRFQASGYSDLMEIYPRLNAAQAKAAVRRWETILENRVSLADILRAEKEYHQARMQMQLRMNTGQQNRDSKLPFGLADKWPISQVQNNRAAEEYDEYYENLVKIAQTPFDPKFKEPAPPASIEKIPGSFMFARSLQVQQRKWTILMSELRDSLLLTAIALHAYRLEHKTYPQNLNQLVPEYLKQVPRDVFGKREPLPYVLLEQEYSLYSVGPDATDNFGRAIEYKPIPARPITDSSRYQVLPSGRGDIVLGVNIRSFRSQ